MFELLLDGFDLFNRHNLVICWLISFLVLLLVTFTFLDQFLIGDKRIDKRPAEKTINFGHHKFNI